MKKLLDIEKPADIRELSIDELEKLAVEIRRQIVDTVAKSGGHLAPSLGVVELTLALHAVYDCPQDRIIWDVSHQAYAHKILTGRAKNFHTLRQWGGISGFCKRSESEYDCFGAGHSSTSISAALGMAAAWARTGYRGSVAAVIGDGALTAGMAFEALNHAGQLNSGLVVILNDNEMSISPNVGSVSRYLTKIRNTSLYKQLIQDAELLLSFIPALGSKVTRATVRLRQAVKHFLVPGLWFEELGFRYMGPVDGHNISALIPVIREARDSKRLAIVHVVTKKGHGFRHAEKNPSKFHGVGPFDKETGQISQEDSNNNPSFTQVFGDTITELGVKDPRIVTISAAMPDGTGLAKFAKTFPERFFDVGICEQHAVTFAAGMACEGLRPVVAIYSTFMQRAYDQIVHDVCLQRLPVVFALDRGGLVGEDGPTHHGVFDIAILGTVPGLLFMAPKDIRDLQRMLVTAVNHNGPVAIRYPRGKGYPVSLAHNPQPVELGPEFMKEGKDGYIVSVGHLAYSAMEAATIIKEKGGPDLGIVDARIIKPLNIGAYMEKLGGKKYIFTLEEGQVRGGFGQNLFSSLKARKARFCGLNMGIEDDYILWGTVGQLREKCGVHPQGIADKVLNFIGVGQVPEA